MKTSKIDSTARSHLGFLATEIRPVLDVLRQNQGKIFPVLDTYADACSSLVAAQAEMQKLGAPDHRDAASIDKLARLRTQCDVSIAARDAADKSIRDICGQTWDILERAGAVLKKALYLVVDSQVRAIVSVIAPHFPDADAASMAAEQFPAIKVAKMRIEELSQIGTSVSSRFGNEPMADSHQKIRSALLRMERALDEAARAEPDLGQFLA